MYVHLSLREAVFLCRPSASGPVNIACEDVTSAANHALGEDAAESLGWALVGDVLSVLHAHEFVPIRCICVATSWLP